MKQCIITGGGSKFGVYLTNALLNQNYYVHLITSNGQLWRNTSNVNVIDIDWKTLDITDIKNLIPDTHHIDMIFFNHNASALNEMSFKSRAVQNPKDWLRAYFVACQFPYYLIQSLSKKLSEDSKVVWMLSALIKYPVTNQIGYADYAGNKFTNACIMKSFSQQHQSCFLGMHPDSGTNVSPQTKAESMIDIVNSQSVNFLNGKIFDSQGNI